MSTVGLAIIPGPDIPVSLLSVTPFQQMHIAYILLLNAFSSWHLMQVYHWVP